MDYDFLAIEQKWQQYWDTHKTFEAANKSTKPKYYVLDMFPYPSGAGLHVGHPLGYIASDIVSRYRRHKGFNVLHPMGFDAFGLPAEQYAIQTGKHPKETTRENITRYVSQMKRIGFAYDWDRTVTTSNPDYYKWTQWIFLKLFGSWYDNTAQKARPVEELVNHFAASGNQNLDAFAEDPIEFTAASWNSWSKPTESEVLMKYRLAYQGDAWVNWCEALGTVLANDEVKDGVSERGGHPVERKKMRNWFLRITAYAERLLADLDTLEWSEAMKEMQRNWIGKSEGAAVRFSLQQPVEENTFLEVFTTRPDTIFGVSFMVLAPEHEWVEKITTAEQKAVVEKYVTEAKNRSERERQADVKRVTGVFTGAYAIHPFTGNPIPIWIGEYVLAGYGTGAVMAVPGHDSRDFAFAKHFGLPAPRVITGPDGASGELEEAYEAKDGTLINAGFLDGLPVKEAIKEAIEAIEAKKIGTREINFRLRDANFSRQRYWGEPFPILFKEGIPEAVAIEDLPVILPDMEDFKPTGKPESPLVKAQNWVNLPDGSVRETDTMPGFAGSSWYFLRYMDAGNPTEFASKEALNYWKDVDLYIGGTEHAVGHLLYARFWHKLLFDYGYVPTAEPFRKLVNQGMILGRSNFVYRIKNTHTFVSEGLKDQYEVTALHVDVNIVNHDILDLEKFRKALPEYKDAEFILETSTAAEGKEEAAGEGIYRCGSEIEKMSKSKLNVVNPDDICDTYGADTLRLYEMFLGPIDQHKPWNIQGIEGVHKFLKKLWRACIDREGNIALTPGEPSKEELKALHKTIKKITEDIENLSLNTCVSAFMILLNELTDLKSTNLSVYKTLLALLSPFAPHLAEELWERTGEKPGTLCEQPFPVFNPEFLVENNFDYPVSFNGKMRFKIHLPLNLEPAEIEAAVKQDPQYERWLEGKTPKKVIVVKGKIINIVI